ncbi:MAG: ABC transporter ATP-binding protein/permease [Peptoniphilus sp.]|uniref:ABC transporter ATP-binding protein n=1 Tax=Peptoniphilus sp. TaxID=1971214 RepID=UPI0025DCF75A|nr:ABC transporter ATP-binding protein [Peptoniphilus sp.]MCI5643489.1 ABC transporter ATP-binding protein/permease [Peptoniphilus sp.]
MKFIKTITLNQPKKIIGPIVYNLAFLLSTFLPFLLLIIILRETLNGNRAYLLLALLIMSYVLQYILKVAQVKKTYRDGYYITYPVRIKAAEHLSKIPLGRTLDKGPSAISNLLINDFSSIEYGLTHIFVQLIANIILIIILAGLLFFVNKTLTLMLFIGLPFSFGLVKLTENLYREAGRKNRLADIEFSERLGEYIDGITEIRTGQKNNFVRRNLEDLIYELSLVHKKNERQLSPLNSLSISILNIGIFLVLVYILKTLPLGLKIFDVLIFLLIAPRVFGPLQESLLQFFFFPIIEDAGIRINEFLQEEELPGEKKLACEKIDIELNNINFAYDKENVILNINEKVSQGKKIGIAGVSGSGKSTLLKLIARFYDVDSGKIFYNNENIKEVYASDIYENISYVFQEGILINGTVEENIRFGNKKATEEDLVAATKAARCYEFIKELPDGFATEIGPKGSMLSGGQRQRITIARALLKNTPILILDEPTSSLDATNEKELFLGLEELIKGRTVFMVSHRLNTIKNADEIWVLDKGKIVEKGNHEELIIKKGLYFNLINAKSKDESWKLNN